MRKILTGVAITYAVLVLVSFTACAEPISAEETKEESLYYAEKYADEAPPSDQVQEVLDFLDGCVGGQYIFGAQGTPITRKYVLEVSERYPDYFSDGRLEYFLAIAQTSAEESHEYPSDYAWDCSGLWWDCANALDLYDEYTDRTAHDTYNDYCSPIAKEDLRPGDIVFIEDDEEGRIVHMGIVGTHGYIYEAVGGFFGVVKKRTVDKRVYVDIVRGGAIMKDDWNLFGRPKIFED